MGFWSKLGKVALKVAPYAAYAIPGVGPIAGMAIQAGLGAANAKVSGGGLKDMLVGAGTGAASAAIPGVGGAAKGLAPTSKGITGILKQTGTNMLTGGAGKLTTGAVLKNAPNLLNMAGGIAGGGQQGPQQQQPDYGMPQEAPQRGLAPSSNIMNSAMSRSVGMPNLAMDLESGRREAIKNQPFRKGYDVNYMGGEEGKTPMTAKMPPIFSGGRGGGGRKRAAV